MRLGIAVLLPALLAASDAGRDWGVERKAYNDPVTGIRVWEMSAQKADNLYFHFSNFTADNRALLFVSDRTGSEQLYRQQLQNGEDHTTHRRSTDRGTQRLSGSTRQHYRLSSARHRGLGARYPKLHDTYDWNRAGSTSRRLAAADRQRRWPFPHHDHPARQINVGDRTDGSVYGQVSYGNPAGLSDRPRAAQPHGSGDLLCLGDGRLCAAALLAGESPDETGNRPFYAPVDPKHWLTPMKEWMTHEAWVAGTGAMTMVNDKIGIMVVEKDGTARVVRAGNYWHAAARPDGRYIAIDDSAGNVWIAETATGSIRLLATGIRNTVPVHGHISFDGQGRYIQFHSGRAHETVAIIDLEDPSVRAWNGTGR